MEKEIVVAKSLMDLLVDEKNESDSVPRTYKIVYSQFEECGPVKKAHMHLKYWKNARRKTPGVIIPAMVELGEIQVDIQKKELFFVGKDKKRKTLNMLENESPKIFLEAIGDVVEKLLDDCKKVYMPKTEEVVAALNSFLDFICSKTSKTKKIEHTKNIVYTKEDLLSIKESNINSLKNLDFDSFLIEHCKKHGIFLSKNKDKIIEAIKKRNGNCPCKMEDVSCPCKGHLEDVVKKGRCHCGLFLLRKPEET